MRPAMFLTALGAVVMGAALTSAITRGDFAAEGAWLTSMPWGIVSLVDLYVGFALFSAWIVYREASIGLALVWVALVLVLGFFAASVYAFLALRGSSGDWRRFWMGKHVE